MQMHPCCTPKILLLIYNHLFLPELVSGGFSTPCAAISQRSQSFSPVGRVVLYSGTPLFLKRQEGSATLSSSWCLLGEKMLRTASKSLVKWSERSFLFGADSMLLLLMEWLCVSDQLSPVDFNVFVNCTKSRLWKDIPAGVHNSPWYSSPLFHPPLFLFPISFFPIVFAGWFHILLWTSFAFILTLHIRESTPHFSLWLLFYVAQSSRLIHSLQINHGFPLCG